MDEFSIVLDGSEYLQFHFERGKQNPYGATRVKLFGFVSSIPITNS